VRLPIVVDTNVVVSGILTSDPNAPTARIVDAMLEGSLIFLLSVDLLAEYRVVLLRPALRARHGLDNSEIDIVLTTLADNAVVRKPIDPPSLPPDRGDRHLWALLAAHPGTTLITGDRALLEHPPDWAKVVAPGDFVHFV
jgi:putative PIN family toxin of toxin-antitoxin system